MRTRQQIIWSIDGLADDLRSSGMFGYAKRLSHYKTELLAAITSGAKAEDPFADYEIRTGKDGKVGIYTKDFNCRLAVFNDNTHCLQQALAKACGQADIPEKPSSRKRFKITGHRHNSPRRTGNDQRDFGHAGDVGDQGFRSLRLLRRDR